MGVMKLWLGQSPPGFSTNWPRTKPQTQPLRGEGHAAPKATSAFAATLTAASWRPPRPRPHRVPARGGPACPPRVQRGRGAEAPGGADAEARPASLSQDVSGPDCVGQQVSHSRT